MHRLVAAAMAAMSHLGLHSRLGYGAARRVLGQGRGRVSSGFRVVNRSFSHILLLPALPLLACAGPVAELGYDVRRTLPHDPDAYTQGLLIHEGFFFESTGRFGESELRQVDMRTGRVVRSHALSEDHFGEGLARVGSKLMQLTWKAGLAFVYDMETWALETTFEYTGEGWGLCYDGESLLMSNGSGTLTRRSPDTFEVLQEIQVTRDGFSVRSLNELECVGDHVYANVYMSNDILRIDKATGRVTGGLDAFALSVESNRPPGEEAVLNGIAYDESTRTFYVTGKLWPRMFEIEITGG